MTNYELVLLLKRTYRLLASISDTLEALNTEVEVCQGNLFTVGENIKSDESEEF